MQIWSLKTCDTCRRAIKELIAVGYAPGLTDVRADGVKEADLKRFFAAFGEALVNRRSTTWGGLSESERQEDPVRLILAHPTLMKRPVIESNGRLTLGWDAKTRAEWLGNPDQTA